MERCRIDDLPQLGRIGLDDKEWVKSIVVDSPTDGKLTQTERFYDDLTQLGKIGLANDGKVKYIVNKDGELIIKHPNNKPDTPVELHYNKTLVGRFVRSEDDSNWKYFVPTREKWQPPLRYVCLSRTKEGILELSLHRKGCFREAILWTLEHL